MAELIDGGKRKEFDSGAVREITDEKGRCDLLPLEICGDFLVYHAPVVFSEDGVYQTFHHLNLSVHSNDVSKSIVSLYNALSSFCEFRYGQHGAETMLLEVSKQYADGAKKYEARNWEKGLPVHCYIDSAARHLLKCLRCDDDEPHDRAFVWNILGAIWTLKNKPEFDDITIKDENI